MKTRSYLIFVTLLLLCFANANAHDFEVDGIYYNITDATAKTVGVTYQGDSYVQNEKYTGTIEIPATVAYNGVVYNVTSVEEGAFYDCSDLQTVLLPNSIVSIKSSAFTHSGINSITIPASVTSPIDYYMFYGCCSLNEIVVDENNKVYDSREGCNAIVRTANNEIIVGSNNSTIPNSVISIGDCSFDSRIGLEELILPSGLKTIGKSAFRACSGLKKVYISETVTSIGQGAFGVCSEIESIVVDENNKVLDSREDCNAIIKTSTNKLLVGCQNTFIPTSITEIGSYAFFHANKLEYILIPSSVTSLGDYAFYGCSSLKYLVSMPTTAPSLGEYALGGGGFYLPGEIYVSPYNTDYSAWDLYYTIKYLNFSQIVTCGDNVVCCIDSDVLHIWGTGDMEDMNYGWDGDLDYNDAPWFKGGYGEQKEFSSIKIHHGVKSIGNGAFYACAYFKSIEIPSSVTSIGENAFYDCSGLTSVTIPEGVTSIGSSAFSYCRSLASVTIPNSVTSIEDYALYECSGLTSVTIGNGVTSIGNHAFEDCSGLTSVTIPNSVTSIGYGAFKYCSGLTRVTIGNGVTSIEGYAFSYCSGLTSIIVENGNSVYDSRENCNAIIVTATNTLIVGCKNTIIPNSVTSIGSSAFSHCSGLTSVTIPNSVTSIEDYAFYYCSGLTSVTIGNSVTSIGISAFYYCSGLKEIYVKADTPPSAYSDTFSGVTTNSATLYVPVGSKDAYAAANGWKKFTNIVEMEFTGIDEVVDEVKGENSKVKDVYDLSGRKVTNPTKGIYIVNGKKVLLK